MAVAVLHCPGVSPRSFSVISEQNKGTVVSMSFPVNMDKQPPAFSSMIPPYSGSMNQYLMELSPVLPPEMYKKI